MKRITSLLFFIWLSVTVKAQEDSLCIRLDSLLRDEMFETSQVGLMVYDLTADSTRFAFNHRQLLRPASTMKLVTAVTALDLLGGDYEYKTAIYYTGSIIDSTLTGDIYCVGGFDPMLTEDDVKSMAFQLLQLGIDSISGSLFADCSMKEALEYGEGWCWDDDNPLLTPLSIGRKNIFTDRLMAALAENNVAIGGITLGEATLPNDAQLVCRYTHGIDHVLMRMLKDSDNFYAESMFYQTAAASGHHPAKASDARNATKRLIGRLGLGKNPYKIADGSGLSLYNYVSAELLTMLLRHAWRMPAIRSHLLPALPIAGVDGTLKDRMKRTAASGNVRAKTGTLTGISSLAGYCTSADGHRLAFAIINQGVMRNKVGKDFQDRVCRVLCETLLTPTLSTLSTDYE